ncbi:MAG TPA: MFS transporter, partial [Gaiellaceae bacterium]
MAQTRLGRNRDFVLLQAGQLLSSAGSSFTSVAYPLLVLSLTHSPAKAGLVSFVRLLPSPLLGLLAGAAADRWDRRRIMLAADAVRALAIGALAIVVFTDPVYWVIAAVAFVEGSGDPFFFACHSGAVRNVVPPEQVPAAIGIQQGRSAAVGIVGPPVGGALFGVARALPFAADAVSY